MRKLLCFVILLPLLAFAGQKAAPARGPAPIAGDEAGIARTPNQNPAPRRFDPPDVALGRMDTVGGSTYDMEFNGPPEQTIYFDPGYGIHVTWIQSADLGGSYPDRSMFYNFYDPTLGAWAFNQGADFMAWGVRVFIARTGFGNLDVHPTGHVAYISAHYGTNVEVTVAQDQAPGTGSFTECANTTDFQLWPAMMMTPTGRVHIACQDDPGRTNLYYDVIDPWCTYSTPLGIAPPAPIPAMPSYNLTCSKRSNTLAITWVEQDLTGAHPWYGYYVKSADDGATWSDAVQLPLPDIYNLADTVSSFEQTSLVPWFDWNDSLHITCMVMPMFGVPLQYILLNKASLWDWCSEFGLRLVHAGNTENMQGIGGNRWFSYCERLVICQTGPSELVAVWNQNDSANIDPTTTMCRADILGRRSGDGGATWGDWVGIRTGGSTSRRYLDIAATPDGDSCDILYLDDLQAGCSISPSPDGNLTLNPMVHQRFSKNDLPIPGAVAEKHIPLPAQLRLNAAVPNPFQHSTAIAYDLPRAGMTSLRIYDNTGRPVRTLVNTRAEPGRYTVTWDGRNDKGASLAAGVYFSTLTAGDSKLTQKLTLLQ